MRTSNLGAKALMCWEAMSLVPYQDPDLEHLAIAAGNQIPKVRLGDTVTIEKGFGLLRTHLDGNDQMLTRMIHIQLTQWAWDAMASFAYNVRHDNLVEVTGALNTIGVERGALVMAKFDKDKKGIAVRRGEEIFRMTHNWYGDTSVYKLYRSNPRTSQPELVPFPEEI